MPRPVTLSDSDSDELDAHLQKEEEHRMRRSARVEEAKRIRKVTTVTLSLSRDVIGSNRSSHLNA